MSWGMETANPAPNVWRTKRGFDAETGAQAEHAVAWDWALLVDMAGSPFASRLESCMVSIAAVIEGGIGIDNQDSKAPAARDGCKYHYDPAVHYREVLLEGPEADAGNSLLMLCERLLNNSGLRRRSLSVRRYVSHP